MVYCGIGLLLAGDSMEDFPGYCKMLLPEEYNVVELALLKNQRQRRPVKYLIKVETFLYLNAL